MKKAMTILMAVLVLIAPAAARTAKEGPEKIYIGVTAGYNGVRDSLPAMFGKLIGGVLAEGMTGGQADTEDLFIMENALALGIDTYYEITPAFSMSLTGGVSVDFNEKGMIPAPFADLFFWGRMNGGPRGDFLMGAGLGTFNAMKPDGMDGWAAILLGMRYQMDASEHMGWWMDVYTGWNVISYGKGGTRFFEDFSVMPGLRTGLSYAF